MAGISQWFLVCQLHNHRPSSVGGLLCIRMYTYFYFRGGHDTVTPLSAANHIMSATTPNRHAGYELIIYYGLHYLAIQFGDHSIGRLCNTNGKTIACNVCQQHNLSLYSSPGFNTQHRYVQYGMCASVGS